jgi:hypothetical protein
MAQASRRREGRQRGNRRRAQAVEGATNQEVPMGRGILLWLLGVPIPIILLLLFFWR